MKRLLKKTFIPFILNVRFIQRFFTKIENVWLLHHSSFDLPSYNDLIKSKTRTSHHLENVKYAKYFEHNESARDRVLRISSYLQINALQESSLVRFGNSFDGGYVLINDISPGMGVISFGVGPDVSFDQALATLGCKVHLYDYSIKELPHEVPGSIFYREKIGYPKSESVTDLEKACQRVVDCQSLLLKCDIEGSEWELLSGVGHSELARFDQIIVEFHTLSRILDDDFYLKAVKSLENLSKTHFVVNIHANNFANITIIGNSPVPDVIEVTWANRLKYGRDIRQKEFFEALNCKNLQTRPEISLAFPIVMSAFEILSQK
jgi:hypothetical protein